MFKRTTISTGVLLALSSLLAVSAQAQQEPQRVEITGSSIKRIDTETALPVTVITRKDIEQTGATTAAELLERLSANNGQGYNQTLALGDSARPGFAGASLRGLGSNTTLVLLNGRRLAVYAFDGGAVDLNSIALGAIERVEILRDGASAVYGTDAIAGVINFITRKDFRGGELTVNLKSPQHTGGKTESGTVTAGFGDLGKDRFNVLANLSYDKLHELKAADRPYASTAFLPNAPGGRFDRTSGNTFPASIIVPGVGTVNPGVPNCLAPYSFQTSATSACRFDYAAVIDILPPQEKKSGLVRGTFALSADHELFLEYNRSDVTTSFPISPSPISNATTFNGDSVLYPAGGRWYPKAVNPATGKLENGLLWFNAADGNKLTRFVPLSGDLSIAWRSLEAGPRTNRVDASQDRLLFGAQGSFGSWDYNTGVMQTTSKATENYVNGWLSETKLLNSTCKAGSGPCGPLNPTYTAGKLDPNINPWGFQDAAGQAALDAAKILAPTRISKSTLQSWDGRVSGELFKLPAGPVGVAFGAESRKESYDDQPQAVLSSGDVIGGGGDQQAVNGSRRVSAVFSEFSIPLFKGFEALAQFRYDKYSDFGNTTNPKFGFRWQASPSFLVRSSYGTGFRAPTLPNLLQPISQTNTGGSYNDPYYEAKVGDCFDSKGAPTANFNPAYCQAQLTVKQGGNPNLGPEKSKQWNIGLVFQPVPDWSATVDLWSIRMRDQIGIANSDALLSDFLSQYLANPNLAYDATTAKLTAAGKAALNAGATGLGITRSATTGYLGSVSAQYQNIASQDTQGIDVSLKGILAKTAYGQFNFAFESAYLISSKQDGVDVVGIYQNFGPVVRMKNSTSFGWTQGPWEANLNYRWQSGYQDAGGLRRVGTYELFDLGARYTGVKNLVLSASIQNLFDRDPPYSRQGAYFQVGYDPTYADPHGRTFTLAAKYTFK